MFLHFIISHLRSRIWFHSVAFRVYDATPVVTVRSAGGGRASHATSEGQPSLLRRLARRGTALCSVHLLMLLI